MSSVCDCHLPEDIVTTNCSLIDAAAADATGRVVPLLRSSIVVSTMIIAAVVSALFNIHPVTRLQQCLQCEQYGLVSIDVPIIWCTTAAYDISQVPLINAERKLRFLCWQHHLQQWDKSKDSDAPPLPDCITWRVLHCKTCLLPRYVCFEFFIIYLMLQIPKRILHLLISHPHV